jgi:Uma2 family endonuclease
MATQLTTAQAPLHQATVTLDEFKRLRHDGYKAELVKGEIKMSPDLAVEILSPHDSVRDLNDKLAEYFDFGVKLVWVVDLDRQTVTVYRSWADAHTLRADETLDGGDVLPDFACRVGEIFD